jgi:hypothetical protein
MTGKNEQRGQNANKFGTLLTMASLSGQARARGGWESLQIEDKINPGER